MLNLKKGLALVLAAATAFTFAPVANLGNAIDANAGIILDTDRESVTISAGSTIYIPFKDLAKTDMGASSIGKVNVHSDDKNIALVGVGDDNGTAATVDDANTTVSASAVAATSGSKGITITGVKAGSTNVKVSAKDVISGREYSETIRVTVDAAVYYLNFDKGSFEATKVGDNKFQETVGTDLTNNPESGSDIGPKVANYTPGTTESGYTYIWKFKSSNKDVVEAPADSAESSVDSLPTLSSSKPKYKGVGTATITVSLVKKKAGKETEVASGDVSVKVNDATDKLEVSYDANRDGSISDDEKASISTTVNKKYGTIIPESGKYTYRDGNVYSDTFASNPGPTNNIGELYLDATKTLYLDNVSHKSGKINVTDAQGRTVKYTSSSKYFSVDNSGNVEISDKLDSSDKQLDGQSGTIIVHVDRVADGNNTTAGLTIKIPVAVYDRDTTTLTVKDDNGNVIATAVGAENVETAGSSFDDFPTVYLSTKDKKSMTLSVESNAGDGFVSGQVNAVTANTPNWNIYSDIVSYDNATKTISATKAGKAIVTITSRNSNKTYNNATVRFGVEVVTKNANNKIQAPATINLTKSSRTATIDAKSTYPTNLTYDLVKAVGSKDAATSTDVSYDGTGKVTYTSENKGTVVIRIQGAETADSLAPAPAYVTVNYGSEKVASPLKVTTKSLELGVDETAPIVATAGSVAVTYTSSDDSIATVDANGTVTAKAAGAAFITVKAAETDDFVGAETLVPVIVNGDKTVAPEKVTGLKVSNKKGAYVSVKWTSQGKNINYRVYKKVGNGKWVGKNVAGNKTTLSVKKGAKVQVKVKSYVKNSAGKTTWGPSATKAKTFKTDKK